MTDTFRYVVLIQIIIIGLLYWVAPTNELPSLLSVTAMLVGTNLLVLWLVHFMLPSTGTSFLDFIKDTF